MAGTANVSGGRSFLSRLGGGGVVCFLLAWASLITGCGESQPGGGTAPEARDASQPLKLVATTAMVADLVRQVAGDRAQVEGLMGEGIDPHLYKPTRGDIARIMAADAVFINGLMLEGRMGDVLLRAATDGRKVYAVTELIDEASLLEPEDMEGHPDPHVWMDVKAWMLCLDVVTRSLSALDPAHAEEYAERALAYRRTLAELDDYVRRVITSIPEAQRVLITAHDAFNYFGRAYAIEVTGIQGISTESEAGLDDINRLIDRIVERGIRAVFVESSVSDKNVRALVEGARRRGHDLVIGGELYSDAMGASGTHEGTYVGMLDHNATKIARALGGEAPARGMQERLAETTP